MKVPNFALLRMRKERRRHKDGQLTISEKYKYRRKNGTEISTGRWKENF